VAQAQAQAQVLVLAQVPRKTNIVVTQKRLVPPPVIADVRMQCAYVTGHAEPPAVVNLTETALQRFVHVEYTVRKVVILRKIVTVTFALADPHVQKAATVARTVLAFVTVTTHQ